VGTPETSKPIEAGTSSPRPAINVTTAFLALESIIWNLNYDIELGGLPKRRRGVAQKLPAKIPSA
jgi:hypothetical protein